VSDMSVVVNGADYCTRVMYMISDAKGSGSDPGVTGANART
jgi:hypothetical protein